jgi:HSP20 family protein
MADITRWDPFSEIQTLRQQLDRMFDDVRPWRLVSGGNGEAAYFPVDLYESAEEVVVKASLPGVKPEDIDISVTGNVLTLRGEAKEEKEEKGETWYRRERRFGSFHRQFQLPTEVDASKAQAVFEHGVLRLTLPKAEAAKPKTIKVEAKPVLEGGKA